MSDTPTTQQLEEQVEEAPEQAPEQARSGLLASGRHPVNIGHLVMGVAFLGLLSVWGLVESEVVDGDDIRWVLPVPWVLAGLAGLVGLVVRERRQTVSHHVGWE